MGNALLRGDKWKEVAKETSEIKGEPASLSFLLVYTSHPTHFHHSNPYLCLGFKTNERKLMFTWKWFAAFTQIFIESYCELRSELA